MKKVTTKLKKAAILFTAMTVCSCAKLQFSDLLMGKIEDGGDAPKTVFQANVQANDPDAPESPVEEKEKAMRDERDSIPYLFLQIAATKTNKLDSILYYYSKPFPDFKRKKLKSLQTDYTEYKVKFVYSSRRMFFEDHRFRHPNSRVDALQHTLQIKSGPNAFFYSIDKIKNDYGEVDLGNAERSQETKFNASGNVEYALGVGSTIKSNNKNTSNFGQTRGASNKVYDSNGNVVGTLDRGGNLSNGTENNTENTSTIDAKTGAKAEMSYANTTAIKEARDIKFLQMEAGFSFDSETLILSQEGKPNGGVSKNAYVTATLHFNNANQKNYVYPANICVFEKLYDENSVPNKSEKIGFDRRTISYLPCNKAEDVVFTVKYAGGIRTVKNRSGRNSRNAMEYDDKVIYYKISETSAKDLSISKNEFCKKIFNITATGKDGKAYVLKMACPNPKEVWLLSDDEPEVFYQWLVDVLIAQTPALLQTTRFKLYFENGGTKVMIVSNNMDIATTAAIANKIDIASIELKEVKRD